MHRFRFQVSQKHEQLFKVASTLIRIFVTFRP
jgi:hypothetical protein